MKKLTLSILFLLFCLSSIADNRDYLWPIAGEKSGSNIIYQPQDYIDGELNFDNLFIEAPEGSIVVAPADGIITDIGISYSNDMNSTGGLEISGSQDSSFDKELEFAREKIDKKLEWLREKGHKELELSHEEFEWGLEEGRLYSAYSTGHLSIRSGKYKIHIFGLSGEYWFKTGQKVEKGDTLGRVTYCYHKIPKPCIEISISEGGIISDPMSPFGIESTFIPPKKLEPITSLTKEQAKEDFSIYMNSLKELYPGLYEVVTERELEEYIFQTQKKIESFQDDLDIDDFTNIIISARKKVHDSHIYSRGYTWDEKDSTPKYQPAITFGFIQDTLICTSASQGYEKHLKRRIISVNGVPADSVKSIISSRITTYDADVREYIDVYLGTRSMSQFFHKPYGSKTFKMDIVFEDGEKVHFDGVADNKVKYTPDILSFFNANMSGDGSYNLKVLNDSTAYLSIETFSLNTVELEEIALLIDSVSSKEHLIIDMRNNSGGDSGAIAKIYSHIALEPLTVNSYAKVDKIEDFEMLKYSENYSPTGMNIGDFNPIAGKEGFYNFEESINYSTVEPDTLINFKNKIYVLADENSISAATIFPAMVVRANRGVIIGRETRTAYHFMTALKFSHMILPNSKYRVAIPLVKLVFDDVVNERVPYGRGVIPDYHVPLTYEELTSANGMQYSIVLLR